MLKVGDCFSSFQQTRVPTNPFSRCKYCNNISRPTKEQGEIFRGQELSLKDLCNESWNPPCPWCAVLARCIKVLEPETLKMIETDPEQPMWCVINRHNVISICWNYTFNMRVIERYSFQLFRSLSTEPLPDGLDIPTCPELALEPGDKPMWDYLVNCYVECLSNHSECRRAQQHDWFPKRLLYIGDNGASYSDMRIVHTGEHHPSWPYIALSHCWGKTQPLRLLTTNITAFQQHVDFDQLSAVFQDCVTFAQVFQVKYVWIDSLCIIQDDRADWAIQARQMDQIYENARIVVAATSSEDGSVPFLGPDAPSERHLRTSHPVEVSALSGTLGPVRARRYASANADLTAIKGPLTTRAWAWQEHVLSTRIIHFTERQVIWECNQAKGSEMMGSLEPRSDALTTRLSGTDNINFAWQHAIHEYGKRSLTYPADRLPALSGVAARFQPLFDTEYCSGLWRNRMILELAWERSENLSLMTSALAPSLDNSVPSWSWASIHVSPFYSFENVFSELTVQYSLTDVDCEPSTNNPLGEVRQGSSVQLEGMYVSAKLISDERGFAILVKDGFQPQLVLPDCRLIEATQTIDGTEMRTIRRALPYEEIDSEEGERPADEVAHQKISGDVLCLLLFSGKLWESETERAIVLILAPLGPDRCSVQRVALGRGGPSMLDAGRSSIPWQWSNDEPWQWTTYEAWDNWEDWFAGAEKGTFRVF